MTSPTKCTRARSGPLSGTSIGTYWARLACQITDLLLHMRSSQHLAIPTNKTLLHHIYGRQIASNPSMLCPSTLGLHYDKIIQHDLDVVKYEVLIEKVVLQAMPSLKKESNVELHHTPLVSLGISSKPFRTSCCKSYLC